MKDQINKSVQHFKSGNSDKGLFYLFQVGHAIDGIEFRDICDEIENLADQCESHAYGVSGDKTKKELISRGFEIAIQLEKRFIEAP